MLQRWVITGDTYERRNLLKGLGARWDARARVWYLPAYEKEETVEKVKNLGFSIVEHSQMRKNSSEEISTAICCLKDGHAVIKGLITQFNQLISYKACPLCLKKKSIDQSTCPTCGSDIAPVDRLVIIVTVDDTTGAIKTRIAGRAAEIFLDLNHGQVLDLLQKSYEGRDSLLLENRLLTIFGREVAFSGRVYLSKFSNLLEMSVRDFSFFETE
ncbi:MAG: DUF5710 domain-containing protein [Candidatus Odinarchaeota archaeon]